MNKKLIRKCPICSNDYGEILHHQSFAAPKNFPLPAEYDVVCCQRCGFVYTDTQASQQDYNRYYQEFSKYESSATTTKWNLSKLTPLLNYLPDKNTSILDIGCANGELLIELKKLGYKNLNGLDPSLKCVQNVKNQGIDVFKGELFSIDSSIPGKKFDCIILSHVLEHICNLQKAADNIVRKLNENGMLYIEVPDGSRYSEYYIVPFHYFDSEHINHFDENSLNNLFLQKNLSFVHYAKKESQVVLNKLYPAVCTLYQKRTRENPPKKIVPNFRVRGSIISYVEKSHNKDKWPDIDKLARSQQEIVVWGAGSYTMRLIKNTCLGKCNIRFFIDIDDKRQGMKINNAFIYSPEKIKEHRGPIIVCSALYSDEIVEQIKALGINNDIIIMVNQKLKLEETNKRNKLKKEKPYVYEKVMKFDEKIRKGESIAIMHLQYNYMCNFCCQHCSIRRFQNEKDGRQLTPADVKELSKQADELGLARFVITGGEPLVFPDLDELVAAIDPKKFYINCDTNGWLLDEKKARHLKSIGIDRIQLSLDSLNAEEHDDFRNKKGSHQRAMRAVDVSLAAGLDIFINSVVTKQRLHSDEFIKFIEYFNKKGVGVFVSYAKPVGAWEGNFDVLVNRQDMKYMEELEKKYNVFTHLTPAYGLNLGCIAVKAMITITQYGDVLPCQYIQISIGNVFKESLKDIIQRGLDIKYFGEHVDTCLIAEDRDFINKYIVKKIYGKPIPVPWYEVFTKEDKTKKPFNYESKGH